MAAVFFLVPIILTSIAVSGAQNLENNSGEATAMKVSWCLLYQTEAWSARLAAVLAGTRAQAVLVDCGSEASAMVNVTDLRGSRHERLKESNETIQQFINAVLRLLCGPLMTVVEDNSELDSLSTSRSIFIVALLREPIEHLTFQTSLLSVVLPETILPVIVVFKSSLIPFSVDRGMKMWVAGGGDLWPTPVNSIERQDELGNGLTEYLNTLNIPCILEYNGKEYDTVKDRLKNVHRLYLLHHTDQLQVLVSELILPLARRFLGTFVFVTVDCDLFPALLRKYHLSKGTELPYFIMMRKGEVEAVHVQHEHIPYTINSLGGLLESVVNPEAHSVDPPPTSTSDHLLVSFIDLQSARSLAETSSIPLLAVFCKHDDPECHNLYQALQSAASVMAKAGKKLSMRLFVIQLSDISEVADLKVDILPSAVVHANHKWQTPFADMLGKSRFLIAIDEYSISGEEAAEAMNEPPSVGEFIPAHQELKEDDPYARLYPSPVALPDSIPHLNSSTYLLFNERHSVGLIAFYLPYCVQCRPLLQHFVTAESQLVAGGVGLAVVNCAGYPDVCTAYNVSIYPTVLYRLSGHDWTHYRGVATAATLLEKVGIDVPKLANHPALEELTPARLPQIMASPALPTLVMLCVKEPSLMQLEVMDKMQSNAQYTKFRFYWINSSLYDQVVSHFLQGEVHPALVVVDYSKKFVFKKELTTPLSAEDVGNFLANITSGKHQPSYVMKSVSWPPKIKPIKFPSEEYLRRESERNRYDGPHQSVPSQYFPPSPPHSPSPLLSSPPHPSSPLSSVPHLSSPRVPLDSPQAAPYQPSSPYPPSPPQSPHEEL